MSTVAVAQLVESRIVIPVVVGSSPISHPKNKGSRAINLVAWEFLHGAVGNHRDLRRASRLRSYTLAVVPGSACMSGNSLNRSL